MTKSNLTLKFRMTKLKYLLLAACIHNSSSHIKDILFYSDTFNISYNNGIVAIEGIKPSYFLAVKKFLKKNLSGTKNHRNPLDFIFPYL